MKARVPAIIMLALSGAPSSALEIPKSITADRQPR